MEETTISIKKAKSGYIVTRGYDDDVYACAGEIDVIKAVRKLLRTETVQPVHELPPLPQSADDLIKIA